MPLVPIVVPTYGSGGLYPPCETCHEPEERFPADLVMESPDGIVHFVCWSCAMTAFTAGGRFDLAASMSGQLPTIEFLRHDPKSPSYRGGR